MSATAYSNKAVTPSDSTNIPDGPCTSLYIGTGGDVTLIASADSTSVAYMNVPSGYTLLVQAKKVLATGTTATDIVAQYA